MKAFMNRAPGLAVLITAVLGFQCGTKPPEVADAGEPDAGATEADAGVLGAGVTDLDGLDDALELSLAQAYLPVLALHPPASSPPPTVDPGVAAALQPVGHARLRNRRQRHGRSRRPGLRDPRLPLIRQVEEATINP